MEQFQGLKCNLLFFLLLFYPTSYFFGLELLLWSWQQLSWDGDYFGIFTWQLKGIFVEPSHPGCGHSKHLDSLSDWLPWKDLQSYQDLTNTLFFFFLFWLCNSCVKFWEIELHHQEGFSSNSLSLQLISLKEVLNLKLINILPLYFGGKHLHGKSRPKLARNFPLNLVMKVTANRDFVSSFLRQQVKSNLSLTVQSGRNVRDVRFFMLLAKGPQIYKQLGHVFYWQKIQSQLTHCHLPNHSPVKTLQLLEFFSLELVYPIWTNKETKNLKWKKITTKIRVEFLNFGDPIKLINTWKWEIREQGLITNTF